VTAGRLETSSPGSQPPSNGTRRYVALSPRLLDEISHIERLQEHSVRLDAHDRLILTSGHVVSHGGAPILVGIPDAVKSVGARFGFASPLPSPISQTLPDCQLVKGLFIGRPKLVGPGDSVPPGTAALYALLHPALGRCLRLEYPSTSAGVSPSTGANIPSGISTPSVISRPDASRRQPSYSLPNGC
jgi:hypothetical protein